MRRPVRPFVTEYRGGSRRPSGPGQSPKVDPFKLEAGASAEPWTPPAQPTLLDPQEDSYEAAMRAADALFSGGRSAPAREEPASLVEHGGEAPQPGPPAGGGRVLRVLDEPPSPEMLRLEAELAPKKRGRKPGSKNKPKAVVGAVSDAVPPSAVASEAPALPAAKTVAAVLAEGAVAAAHRPAASTAPSPDAPRGERYAWVRTRLKPGEQWKRRLPKIAW